MKGKTVLAKIDVSWIYLGSWGTISLFLCFVFVFAVIYVSIPQNLEKRRAKAEKFRAERELAEKQKTEEREKRIRKALKAKDFVVIIRKTDGKKISLETYIIAELVRFGANVKMVSDVKAQMFLDSGSFAMPMRVYIVHGLYWDNETSKDVYCYRRFVHNLDFRVVISEINNIICAQKITSDPTYEDAKVAFVSMACNAVEAIANSFGAS